tara:strand:+ start:1198 stop:1479 length:282 start_codon:yes stop_codon:yes gene_type:complete
MTVKELKEKCREQGLKVTGTKKQLIERLENPDTNDIVTNPNSTKVTVGFNVNDPKKVKLNPLLLKGFAYFIYYSCDKWYYEIDKEKWTEVFKS